MVPLHSTHMATTATTDHDTLRDRVSAEASRLFTRFGVRGVTMDDIAERLHVSKRTIYEHFRDKDELLMVCVRKLAADRRRERAEILEAAPNVIEGIFAVMNYAATLIQQTNPSFLLEIERYHPAVLAVVQEFREKEEYEVTVGLIERGIEQGLFVPAVDVDISTRLVLAQFDVIMNEDLFPPDRYSKVELLRTVIINFVRGIATEAGRKLIDTLLEEQSI